MVAALIEMEIRRRKVQEGAQEFCLGGLNWRCLLDRRQMDRCLESVAKAGHTDTHMQMPAHKLIGWGETPGPHWAVGSDSGLLRRHCPPPTSRPGRRLWNCWDVNWAFLLESLPSESSPM